MKLFFATVTLFGLFNVNTLGAFGARMKREVSSAATDSNFATTLGGGQHQGNTSGAFGAVNTSGASGAGNTSGAFGAVNTSGNFGADNTSGAFGAVNTSDAVGAVNTSDAVGAIECGKVLLKKGKSNKKAESTLEGQWPWEVAVYQTVPKHRFICGGTLVSKRHVITAAHCVTTRQGQLDKSSPVVYLGIHNIEDFGEKVQNGTVVGWSYADAVKEPKLLLAPVISQEMCIKSFSFFEQAVSDSTFCAGLWNGCIDSGHGMVFEKDGSWYLRGVVSVTVANQINFRCDPEHYTIIADVAQALPWIKENIKET